MTSEQRLTAAVQDPLPKKSPPLRSSRPRQQVSSAIDQPPRPVLDEIDENSDEKVFHRRPEFDPRVDLITKSDDATAGTKENNSTSKGPSYLSPNGDLQQLTSAVYQKPANNALKLSVSAAQPHSPADIPSGTTTIEDDSQLSHIPGSFPQDEPPSDLMHSEVHQSFKSHDSNDAALEDSPILKTGDQPSYQSSPTSKPDHCHALSVSTGLGSVDGDDAGTIQIMLGDHPISRPPPPPPPPPPQQQQQHDIPADSAKSPNANQDDPSSTSIQALLRPENRNLSDSAVGSDGDAYSVFLKIIGHYDENGTVSPEMEEELSQHFGNISPTIPELRSFVNDLSQQPGLEPVYPEAIPAAEQEDRRFHRKASPYGHEDSEKEVGPPPPPPPKDHLLGPTSHPSIQVESQHSQARDRSSSQTNGTQNSDHPSLPEIQDTGGELNLPADKTLTPGHADQFIARLRDSSRQTSSTTQSAAGSDEVRYYPDNHDASSQHQPPYETPNSSTSHAPSMRSSDAASREESQDRDTDKIPVATFPVVRDRQLSKRFNLLKELVDTEDTFSRDMKVMEDIWMGTAASRSDISTTDIKILFGNAPDVVKFSESFYKALKDAVRPVYKRRDKLGRESSVTSSSDMTDFSSGTEAERDRKTYVGQIFCSNMPRFEKIYGDYMKNHDFANKRLEQLQRMDRPKAWMNECLNYSKELTTAWNLDSLLVKPTQRALKYALILESLIDVTPPDHPDRQALEQALEDIRDASNRINDSKKRAEVLDGIIGAQKSKDLDLSKALGKAFGRRADKLRQQVGLAEVYDDDDYRQVLHKYQNNRVLYEIFRGEFQKIIESYKTLMQQWLSLAEAWEFAVEVGASPSPEIESKWRANVTLVRDIQGFAYNDLMSSVYRKCTQPMEELERLYNQPEKLMTKRKKRLPEYAKYRSLLDQGVKPDKRTVEQGEQFLALNDTLKDELPKLYHLTEKFMKEILGVFASLKTSFWRTIRNKLQFIVEDKSTSKLMRDNIPDEITKDMGEIHATFKSDYQILEHQVMELGICNGSTLADTSNFMPSMIATPEDSSKRPSTTSRDTHSTKMQNPSSYSTPDFHNRGSAGSTNRHSPLASTARPSTESGDYPIYGATGLDGNGSAHGRSGSGSGGASRLPQTSSETMSPASLASSSGTFFFGNSPQPTPPLSTAAAGSYEGAGSYYNYPMQSQRPHLPPQTRSSNATFFTANASAPVGNRHTSSSPRNQSSSVFSSAMPLSDSPKDTRSPTVEKQTSSGQKEHNVIFLAASLYEFKLTEERKQAGYKYLTYMPGEIFDVLGTNGELWLAKNQDDPTETIGWIWEKHFARLVAEE